MQEQVKNLIKPIIVVAIIIFVLCWIIDKPLTSEDCLSYIGYSISGVTILFILYEQWLWRYIPWNRPPVLKKHYNGVIRYTYKRVQEEKHIEITVKQTLFSVCVETKTDINSSYTVSGIIVKECDNYILYYTYITNPNAVVQKSNPIQYGTCRMVLNNKNTILNGKYWTSSQTVGDIEWRS